MSNEKSIEKLSKMSNEKSVMAVIRAARPSFRNNPDKVAFAVHAAFLSSGLVLTATGPDASNDNVFASTSTTDEVGIENWNQFNDRYAFVYIDPEKESKKILVKCMVMNDKLLLDALVDGSSQPLHLQIDIDNYVVENANGNYSVQYKNLEKLVKDLDKEIFFKLYPSYPSRSETGEGSRRKRRHGGGDMHLGARVDPFGPPRVRGFNPNRFIRNPPGRPRRGPHPL